MSEEKDTVQLNRKILNTNDIIAQQNAEFFLTNKVLAVNMISSPGSGKTSLLEKTLQIFQGHTECAVITGDQQTDNDAKRLLPYCPNVYQIETGDACHLNAKQVAYALPKVVRDNTEILFIENIGNLVCPTAFNLGEEYKIALLSVTEGEDKPSKYPALFAKAKAVVITKTDLLPHLDFDIKLCRENIKKVNSNIKIIELSTKTGDGLQDWIDFLQYQQE